MKCLWLGERGEVVFFPFLPAVFKEMRIWLLFGVFLAVTGVGAEVRARLWTSPPLLVQGDLLARLPSSHPLPPGALFTCPSTINSSVGSGCAAPQAAFASSSRSLRSAGSCSPLGAFTVICACSSPPPSDSL